MANPDDFEGSDFEDEEETDLADDGLGLDDDLDEDLDEDGVPEVDDDLAEGDDAVADDSEADDTDDDDEEAAPPPDEPAVEEEEEEVPDLDEEEDDEEAEQSLEQLLGADGGSPARKKRGAKPASALGETTNPAGEGEFTCRSCFLVKRRAQLADEKSMICFDCA